MTEPERSTDKLDELEQEKEPFVPSPVSRRIWAWMGVVYVVIAMLLVTYWIGTNTFITGITGILLFPLLGAMAAQGFNNYHIYKLGQRPGPASRLVVTAVIMALLALSALVLGIAELITYFGG